MGGSPTLRCIQHRSHGRPYRSASMNLLCDAMGSNSLPAHDRLTVSLIPAIVPALRVDGRSKGWIGRPPMSECTRRWPKAIREPHENGRMDCTVHGAELRVTA